MTAVATIAPSPAVRRAAETLAADLTDALTVPPPPETSTDRSPASPRWRGQSLSKGAAGIAILHGVLAHAGLGPWEPVHAWLNCANRDAVSAGPGAGLWYGAAALGFAISVAAPPGTYRAAQARLDDAVVTITQTRLRAAADRIHARRRPTLAEFDLTQGLTGLGGYWLHRDNHPALLRQILTYLVLLCDPLPADDPAATTVPGWWTTDVPPGSNPDDFAGGWSDQGQAHGISGPLALLALAARRHITVPGHTDAMQRICQWLDGWRQDGPTGPWWPERLTLAELRAGQPRQGGPARPSWCYGLVGICRSMQLAGLALGDTGRQDTAETALIELVADPDQLARLANPALCHGLAGVLATSWYAAADARSPALADHLPELTRTLVNDHAAAGHRPAWRRPGLVEGSAGVALTLHTITTEPTASISGGWPTCLLIT